MIAGLERSIKRNKSVLCDNGVILCSSELILESDSALGYRHCVHLFVASSVTRARCGSLQLDPGCYRPLLHLGSL